MQDNLESSIAEQAERFLHAWFTTRRLVQTLNFNRFQQEGLSASQFITLNLLGEASACLGPADLARRQNLDVTTTMRTVQSLVTRGLVEKRRDPHDKRRTVVELTSEGSRAHARLHDAFATQVIQAFAALNPEQRNGLVDGLEAFVRAADHSIDRVDRG